MLRDRNSSAILAVADIERARAFYEETLGLRMADRHEEAEVLTFRTGDTFLILYQSEYAGTNQGNAVSFAMKGDLIETVQALRAKGVEFIQYDQLRGLDFKDGVYSSGVAKLAWFKDPDGNILHLAENL